jgi:hypothetical protein
VFGIGGGDGEVVVLSVFYCSGARWFMLVLVLVCCCDCEDGRVGCMHPAEAIQIPWIT